MKTVAAPEVLRSLAARLGHVGGDSVRRWGSLSAHEMLCHLGDSAAWVLGTRPMAPPPRPRRRPFMKMVGLWLPIPWPRGIPTRPSLDPRAEGTRPSEMEADRARAIAGLERIASAAPGSLIAAHTVFGSMTLRDWQRWAYRHTDHHLRQFGA